MKRKEEKKKGEDFELLEKDPPHTRERYHAETFYETSNQYVPNLEM